MSRRYCQTLDLKDDSTLIAGYKRYHEKIWPEITRSFKDAGILDLEIYFESFSFEKKAQADRQNPKVQEWKYQKALPEARPSEKWLLMERIFKLES